MKLAAVKLIPQDHISLTSQSAMQTVCQPLLKAMNLNFYTRVQIHQDGTLWCLTTHANWHQYHWEHGYSADKIGQLKTGSIWWGADPRFNQMQWDSKQYFDVDNKYHVIQVHDGYVDIHGFGMSAQSDRSVINDIYMNRDNGRLDRFLLEFHSHPEMDRLIQQANQKNNRLRLVERHHRWRFSANDGVITNTVIPLDLKKYNFCGVWLSRREVQCCMMLLIGKTQQETADKLFVARETVKKYLDKAQEKLECMSRSDLQRKLIDLKFHKLFHHVF